MGITSHGTVAVPSAGLSIGVSTCDTSEMIALRVSRHGIPIVVELTPDEAGQLDTSLFRALKDLRARKLGVPS